MNEFAKAQKALEACLKINPDLVPALDLKAVLEKGHNPA